MSDSKRSFVGPCLHGRDPYTRCDEGCEKFVRCVETAERERIASMVESLAERPDDTSARPWACDECARDIAAMIREQGPAPGHPSNQQDGKEAP